MPIYQYIADGKPCIHCREGFELLQKRGYLRIICQAQRGYAGDYRRRRRRVWGQLLDIVQHLQRWAVRTAPALDSRLQR